MHAQDAREAAARFADAAYNMQLARARYRVDIKPAGESFRHWARRTYNAHACTGKIAQVVRRKEEE